MHLYMHALEMQIIHCTMYMASYSLTSRTCLLTCNDHSVVSGVTKREFWALYIVQNEFEVLKRLLGETEKERQEEEGQKKHLVLQVQRLTESKKILEAQLLSIKQNNVPTAQVQLTVRKIGIHLVGLVNSDTSCLVIENVRCAYIAGTFSPLSLLSSSSSSCRCHHHGHY